MSRRLSKILHDDSSKEDGGLQSPNGNEAKGRRTKATPFAELKASYSTIKSRILDQVSRKTNLPDNFEAQLKHESAAKESKSEAKKDYWSPERAYIAPDKNPTIQGKDEKTSSSSASRFKRASSLLLASKFVSSPSQNSVSDNSKKIFRSSEDSSKPVKEQYKAEPEFPFITSYSKRRSANQTMDSPPSDISTAGASARRRIQTRSMSLLANQKDSPPLKTPPKASINDSHINNSLNFNNEASDGKAFTSSGEIDVLTSKNNYFSDKASSDTVEQLNTSVAPSFDMIYDQLDSPRFECDFSNSGSAEEDLVGSLIAETFNDTNVRVDGNETSQDANDEAETLVANLAASDFALRKRKQPIVAPALQPASNSNTMKKSHSCGELSSLSSESTSSGGEKRRSRRDIVSSAVKLSSEYFPAATQPYVLSAEPYLAEGAEILELAISWLMLVLELTYALCMFIWTLLEPVHSEIFVLLPSFFGLVICFFGGSFMTTISAVEAYRLCGYETTLRGLSQIYTDLRKVYQTYNEQKAALPPTSPVAKAIDGPAEKSPEKFHMPDRAKSTHEQNVDVAVIFLRTVDPNTFIEAVVGVNMGLAAVLATLKLSFAKTITLGQSLSNIVTEPANEYVLPLIEFALPEEHRKWAKPVLKYSIRSACISVAWTLRRVISSYHSAITGGLMFSRNTLSYFKIVREGEGEGEGGEGAGGKVTEDLLSRCLVGLVAYSVAALGIYFQLSLKFSLPFPLNIVLFPFTIVEYLLVWMVNHSANILVS